MHLILKLLLFSSFAFSLSPCEDWFSKLKINKGSACAFSCESAVVDMRTFNCHGHCKELCASEDNSISYNILKLYGLSSDEIKICDESPSMCVSAYIDGIKAEKICNN